ncbi:MAG: hypothetical protein GY716_25070 [bacterium]|nr:hypothetical protein [bacterium]
MLSRTRLIPAAVLLVLGLSCSPNPGPATPENAALDLFDLAAQQMPADDDVGRRFGLDPDDPRRAALLDALETVADVRSPRVLAVQEIEEGTRFAVDVTAELTGGGSAVYSVQLERVDGEFVVHWFGGPGASWPDAAGRRPGLTNRPDRAPH